MQKRYKLVYHDKNIEKTLNNDTRLNWTAVSLMLKISPSDHL